MKILPSFFNKMKFFKRKDKSKDEHLGYSPAFPGSGGSNGYNARRHPSLGSPPHDPFIKQDSLARRPSQFRPMATRSSPSLLLNLPAGVLARIFSFVCLHANDETYETCEQSSLEDACMLCDLRDLAHCTSVCRTWRKVALRTLYHSIRIDTVHYCEREVYLSERRKRRSFFDRNSEPEDTAQARLKLLCRTLREDPARLGPVVEFFKTPYMLRESCQADLARTIAVLPNLKYVDLPEGLFMDDPAFLTLRLEVQARCRDIRKMTYMGGAERSLQQLAAGTIWVNLEVLELIKINLDPTVLRQVLGNLPNLRAVKISEAAAFTDEALFWNDMLLPFPPLDEFILNDAPYVTAEGLKQWLSLPEAQQTLKVLTLNRTGVRPWHLHEVAAAAPALKHLSILDTVNTAMPSAAGTQNIPPLASKSLRTLHYEVMSASSPTVGTTTSYYSYLASALLSGCLPNLRAVYVRDPNFADTLLGLPPPMPSFADRGSVRPSSSGSNRSFSSPFSAQGGFAPPFAPQTQNPFGSLDSSPPSLKNLQSHGRTPSQGLPPPSNWAPGHNPRFSSNNPFASMVSNHQPPSIANLPHMLEVFTKGEDEPDWSFVKMDPSSALAMSSGGGGSGGGGGGGPGAPARPSSSYGLGADVMGGNNAGWSSNAGARRSIFVGGSTGGFLEVPSANDGSRRRGRSPGAFGGSDADAAEEAEDLWPRPKSSGGEKKRDRMDLWR